MKNSPQDLCVTWSTWCLVTVSSYYVTAVVNGWRRIPTEKGRDVRVYHWNNLAERCWSAEEFVIARWTHMPGYHYPLGEGARVITTLSTPHGNEISG